MSFFATGLSETAVILSPSELAYKQAIEAGYTIPDSSPEVRLGLHDSDRAQFVALITLLDEAGEDNPVNVPIIDTAGGIHNYPVAQIRPLLVGYGLYYQSLLLSRYAN